MSIVKHILRHPKTGVALVDRAVLFGLTPDITIPSEHAQVVGGSYAVTDSAGVLGIDLPPNTVDMSPTGTSYLVELPGVSWTAVVPDTTPPNTQTPVASEADMLALSAVAGDLAIRTDLANARLLLVALPAATLGNWKPLGTDPGAPDGTIQFWWLDDIRVGSAPEVGPLFYGVPTPPATAKVLTSTGAAPGDFDWEDPTGGGGGGTLDLSVYKSSHANGFQMEYNGSPVAVGTDHKFPVDTFYLISDGSTKVPAVDGVAQANAFVSFLVTGAPPVGAEVTIKKFGLYLVDIQVYTDAPLTVAANIPLGAGSAFLSRFKGEAGDTEVRITGIGVLSGTTTDTEAPYAVTAVFDAADAALNITYAYASFTPLIVES